MPDSPDVLPLQLLQPLDANQQGSEPTPLGGVHRPLVSPDPGVHHPAGAAAAGGGDERGWRSSRLRIHRNGQTRSIWAVHLPGWQQLGWQLLPPAAGAADPGGAAGAAVPGDERSGLVLPGLEPDGPFSERSAGPESDLSDEAAPDPEALTATELTAPAEVPNFQAMTKAQIISHCLSNYGVSLDGDRTKSDLVAAATALAAGDGETEAVNEAAADADAGTDPDPNADPDPLLTQPVADPAAGGDLSSALADPIDLQLPDDLL